ncbi:MAG: FKBP-type peptidyl-prolyl cis-trans isomerase [Bernardetiaceae bacterium]|jgi:FKBP-type peptidyl-prolyl cis-trans isomerase|nr:FKBP-type peptidyl-prolyl cis-trans isomerase [Bernardetiaceae bacterium]
MQKFTLRLGIVVLSLATMAGCKPSSGTEKTLKEGLRYVINEKKTQDTTAIGMLMTVNLIVKAKIKGKDTVLNDTYKAGEPIPVQVGMPNMGAMGEVFSKLAKGDSATIFQKVDSIPSNPMQPMPFDKGSELSYGFRVVNVQTEMQFKTEQEALQTKRMAEAKDKDDKAIQDYLAKNNIKAEKQTSGLYANITAPGTGAAPQPGDEVTVHYTGKLIDGTMFQSTVGQEPMSYAAGVGRMIPGFDEGVMKLKEGGKAQLFIPSGLGYGPQGGPQGSGIPPFAVIIFDIELVKVKANKPEAVQPK